MSLFCLVMYLQTESVVETFKEEDLHPLQHLLHQGQTMEAQKVIVQV